MLRIRSARDCPECDRPGSTLDSRDDVRRGEYGRHRRRQCGVCKVQWTTREYDLDDVQALFELAARQRAVLVDLVDSGWGGETTRELLRLSDRMHEAQRVAV